MCASWRKALRSVSEYTCTTGCRLHQIVTHATMLCFPATFLSDIIMLVKNALCVMASNATLNYMCSLAVSFNMHDTVVTLLTLYYYMQCFTCCHTQAQSMSHSGAVAIQTHSKQLCLALSFTSAHCNCTVCDLQERTSYQAMCWSPML